ncbi:hypothetical protein [Qipengyuania nanhaisediminis]|uniref:hypothetical protein n=1 Tax=Qipengyuania nanhaisediminis TaxID=604088 RepID=UPI0038B384EF
MSTDPARARHFVISISRIFAVLMVVAGLMVLRDVIDLPDWAGYALIGFGLADFFVVPLLLSRRWSSGGK